MKAKWNPSGRGRERKNRPSIALGGNCESCSPKQERLLKAPPGHAETEAPLFLIPGGLSLSLQCLCLLTRPQLHG